MIKVYNMGKLDKALTKQMNKKPYRTYKSIKQRQRDIRLLKALAR